MKQIRKRLTYANVMSSIAVFLVLGGSAAYAAQKIGSNEIKGSSITTGKLKKEAVTASKLKGSSVTTAKLADGAVTTAKIAGDAVTGDKVRDGSLTGAEINVSTLGTVPNASNAGSAQPVAFAQVSSAGKLISSKNVGNVTKASVSGYCFTGIPFAPKGGNATVDYKDSGVVFAQLGLGDGEGLCPSGTQAFVGTFQSTTAAASPAGFFVVFFG